MQCLSGRFTFERIRNTKERRIIPQKSGGLNNLNKQMFQVIIQMQGWINDSWNGVHKYKGVGVRFDDFISIISSPEPKAHG